MISSAAPAFAHTPPVAVCDAPVCAKFGHTSIAHDVFSAVAIWSFNECMHCKAALTGKMTSRSEANSVRSVSPTSVDAVPVPESISASIGTTSPSFTAATARLPTEDDMPSVTLDDDEVVSVLSTDGYGMMMDEQVSVWVPGYSVCAVGSVDWLATACESTLRC